MGRRCTALMKAGVPASFIPIRGAGHGFEGADAERAFAALIQWFEQHLGVQPVADAAAAARDGDAELARPKNCARSSGRHGSPSYVSDLWTARCS